MAVKAWQKTQNTVLVVENYFVYFIGNSAMLINCQAVWRSEDIVYGF